jgi:hypothetical protein
MTLWRSIIPSSILFVALLALLIVAPHEARTQQDPAAQRSQKTPTIDEYQPKSTLVTRAHKIERAKFPFIDIHSHHWNPTAAEVDALIKGMDSINLRVMVNLSGGTGEQLRKTVEVMKGRYPDRFVVFANMSYDDLIHRDSGNAWRRAWNRTSRTERKG